jgi:hypothetical protein
MWWAPQSACDDAHHKQKMQEWKFMGLIDRIAQDRLPKEHFDFNRSKFHFQVLTGELLVDFGGPEGNYICFGWATESNYKKAKKLIEQFVDASWVDRKDYNQKFDALSKDLKDACASDSYSLFHDNLDRFHVAFNAEDNK